MSVDFRQRTPGELARMVWRRKWLIVLPTAAVAVAVAYVVWRLPNVYESTTLLAVRPATIAAQDVTQLSDSDLTLRINNITQEVTSRSTLQPLIERFSLYPVERRRGVPMEELVERMRTKDLKITLNTSRNEITNGFFLSFRGEDPRDTQKVTEALAAKYVESQRTASSDETRLTKEFFDGRVEEQKQKLDDIDRRRLAAMQTHMKSLPSQLQALVGQLAGLREEQKARIQEIGRIRDQIAFLNRTGSELAKANQQAGDETVIMMQDPKGTPAYAELVTQKAELGLTFKPAAPEMRSVQKQIDEIAGQMSEMVEEHKRKVEETRARIENRIDPRLGFNKAEVQRLEAEATRQQAQLDRTETEIAVVGQQLSGVPVAEVELEAIEREYGTEKAIYDQ